MVVFNVADSVTTELCIHHSNKNLTEGNSWGKALLDNNLFWVFQTVKQLLVIGIAIFITLYCCFSTPLFEQAFKTKKKVK